MRVKLFVERASAKNARVLEEAINDWLAANPDAKPVLVERLAHPTFGWGHFVISVWYDEA